MLNAVVFVLGAAAALTAAAQQPILIGEISSYSTVPAFTIPYRNGWELAVEEINAAGGLLGRKLEVISRDDGGKPDDATRHASELLTSQKVDLLAGTFLSNVGLAVSDIALRNKVLFVAAEPLTDALVWEKGNRYTFRLRPSTYMQSAMLVEEAAKLPAKRWATLAPNYEYGQSAVASFKELLKAKRPDVEFVAEQWPALGKLEAGATVQALAAAKPDAIFNVTFGADLTKFVREGNLRGLFEKPRRGQHADRRAGIPRSAQGRDADGLDRHRLSVGPDQDARAPEVRAGLPEALSTIRRASARWWATPPSWRSPRRSRRPDRPTPRS